MLKHRLAVVLTLVLVLTDIGSSLANVFPAADTAQPPVLTTEMQGKIP